MSGLGLVVAVARPEDAETWVRLRYLGRGQPPPDEVGREVAQFRATPSQFAGNRFIGWLGGAAIAGFELNPLESVVEIRNLFVAGEYLANYGPEVLREVVRLAGERGSVLTAEYPEAYSQIFVGAGFKQNTRTMMKQPLSRYRTQPVAVPDGVTLRHPVRRDEADVAEMAFQNYRGAFDHDLVSSSRAQAAAMVRAMFNDEYAIFRADCSYVAEDTQHQLVGSCLLGDVSKSQGEKLIWVLDISNSQEWRGKGLGKALLGSALNAAKEAGFDNLGLTVTIGNDNAYALYRSYGFEEYGSLMFEAVLKVPG